VPAIGSRMIGTTVSHYRVIEKLGAGGMGVVYRAEDLRLGRHVAVKFLPESSGADPLAIERFEREARTASALNHPNICIIHDVGHDNDRRFIVMELIDGVTLDRLIASGPLSLDRVLEIGIGVADALEAAHAEGILHRDIKPGNIFITRREQVKVVDFGLAKMMRPGVPADLTVASPHFSTSVGIAVGTVAYMSPEHARGEALDARSDLFSLGVVIYEMATGVQTFRGQTTAVIFDQILNRVPPAPSSVNPKIPPQLEQIVARALEKDRRHRYQSTSDLRADLERLQRDITTRRAVQAASATAGATVSVAQAWASRSQGGELETLMMSGSAFTVPDPAPPPRSAPISIPAPDSEDIDRERISAAAAALAATPAVSPAASPLAESPLAASPLAASPLSGPAADSPALPQPNAGPRDVNVGAVAVDPNAATIVAPPHLDAAAESFAAADTAVSASPSPPAPSAPAPQRPTLTPRRVSGGSIGPIAAIGALALVGLGGAGWWLLNRPEVPVGASEAPAAAPSTPTPPAATPTSAPAPSAPAPAIVGAVAAGSAALPPAAPAPRRANAATRAADAATALTEARALVAQSADDRAMSALENVSVTYAGTPSATEALALTAELRQQRNELDAAINAWVAYAGRNGDAERGGEGLIRTADAAARGKTAANDEVARRALDELLTRFPGASRAERALQMKMALEDRLKLKQKDDQFGAVIPASVITARTVAARAGNAPVAELALWRLAGEYKDRRLHALAAQTFADLGARFPNTRYDAWYSAAEIYDRQLKDPARARDAYLKVPPSSSRYDEAQKRARR
jgi:serine/threonine protein kinase/TolA-binding protein